MTVTQAEQTTQAPEAETAEGAIFGRLVAIDPLDFDPDGDKGKPVIVDPYNHRKKRKEGDTVEPDPALIASVAELGVQQAIILRPQVGENKGKLGIVIGQRRTLAALRAATQAVKEGREYLKVPAIIRDDLKGVDDEALTVSMVENLHRRQASAQDDVDAAEQLAILVKAKRVPKARKRSLAAAIGRTEEELDAAHRVAQMDAETLEDLREDEVEFDWVELADYDEVKDVSGAKTALMRAKAKDEQEGNAKRGAWKTAMQELRAKKARAERIETLTAELAEKKVKTLRWSWNWAYGTARPLEELTSAIGMAMSEQGHSENCEGHAATIDPDEAEVVWLCTDWKKHGHRLAGDAQNDSGSGDGEPDEEAAAKAEAEREERRRVKVNNLAWRTARDGREAHIAEMCRDKGEAPADVKDLIMRTLLMSRYPYVHYVGGQHHGEMLAKFLGDKRLTDRRPEDVITSLLKKTASKRYWWVLFAHVAGMYEAEHMKDDAWRGEPHYHHGPSVRGAIRSETAQWIAFLKRHGYGLTEVEEETLATAEREAKEKAEREAEAERKRQEREAARAAEEDDEDAEDGTPDPDGEDEEHDSGAEFDDTGADEPEGHDGEPAEDSQEEGDEE
ncbi:ParB/RepB/Spo0J family partition protein [Streptomyces scabiei]|uniref:ParB/RepB/Spo0J family partition protein n=1 Tax=Streptomyces scabiei TaxID=1930 RepID=UPI00298FD68A|nr:ParB/RepB/Spo0J family partition protein [Streptomyces scabiei]MDW8809959.1 ParB/RepB/Spo0J family partition protein [Streptomyces scabiei]